ncbi:Methyltransferase type 12, partial [mine drainage metagenome]
PDASPLPHYPHESLKTRMNSRQHWEDLYQKKDESDVSWFQLHPDHSLHLIRAVRLQKSDAIIDIGGGASRLVDHLLDDGLSDVTVLDIAENGLEQARVRLGGRSRAVHWIVADITRWRPERSYRLWHDRAVFHFLADPIDRTAYKCCLESALMPGGTAILATFAPDGPTQCSGLPVERYSPESLADWLGSGFERISSQLEEHLTPAGNRQQFQYSVFVKRGTHPVVPASDKGDSGGNN